MRIISIYRTTNVTYACSKLPIVFINLFPDAFPSSFSLTPDCSPNLLNFQPSFPSPSSLPSLLYLLFGLLFYVSIPSSLTNLYLFPLSARPSTSMSSFHNLYLLNLHSTAYVSTYIWPSPLHRNPQFHTSQPWCVGARASGRRSYQPCAERVIWRHPQHVWWPFRHTAAFSEICRFFFLSFFLSLCLITFTMHGNK